MASIIFSPGNERVPGEILNNVISHLDPAALISLSQTSRYFREIIRPMRSDFLQRLLFLELQPETSGWNPILPSSRIEQTHPMFDHDIWKTARYACSGCLKLLPHIMFEENEVSDDLLRKPFQGCVEATKSSMARWKPLSYNAREDHEQARIAQEEREQAPFLKEYDAHWYSNRDDWQQAFHYLCGSKRASRRCIDCKYKRGDYIEERRVPNLQDADEEDPDEDFTPYFELSPGKELEKQFRTHAHDTGFGTANGLHAGNNEHYDYPVIVIRPLVRRQGRERYDRARWDLDRYYPGLIEGEPVEEWIFYATSPRNLGYVCETTAPQVMYGQNLRMILCSECRKWQIETAFSYSLAIAKDLARQKGPDAFRLYMVHESPATFPSGYISCNHCMIDTRFRSLESASEFFARMMVLEMEGVLAWSYAQIKRFCSVAINAIGYDLWANDPQKLLPAIIQQEGPALISPFTDATRQPLSFSVNPRDWDRKRVPDEVLPAWRKSCERLGELSREHWEIEDMCFGTDDYDEWSSSYQVLENAYLYRSKQLDDFERRHAADPLWVIKYFIAQDRFGRVPSLPITTPTAPTTTEE
ncbi:hypothetical protein QBC35DRAFT_538862 [Podospora australis]|uniref:F-box domain-containing protein n=1 Tax=Podospora australis TaxID=1536484 RepID=A0AAN6X173_9PEZI|nr:hypothetical protein QBC35DRAFT_538862 [Podospora australis]